MSKIARSAHERVCRGCLVSETARSAHGRVFRGCLVSETARSAHGRVFRVVLVSKIACSAHGMVCQGYLVSETARSAHGRVFRGCLVSETARSAHERVCRGCLVSKTEHSAHGRVFQGCLVSETACSAHERVCRCAFGRRRVCVVTEESRHPYVILPCTPERQKGAEVSPKRAAWHSRATKSAKSVAPECSAAPLGDGKSNKIITTKKSDCQFADSPTFFVYLSFETVPWGGARLEEGS